MMDPSDLGSIPTARNIDHFAFTVPDLNQAADFFVRAFGAQELYRLRESREPGDTWLSDHLGVDPQAVADIAMLRLGPVTNIELFQYSSVERSLSAPRNHDIGGYHLAFLVDDVDLAAEYFRGMADVRVLGEPQVMGMEYPNAGDRWIYLVTSWGFHFEVHSVPDVMPYQSSTQSRRFGAGIEWTDGGDGSSVPVIPSVRTVDHLGITVGNLDQTIEFLVRYLGAEHLYTLGPFELEQPFASEQLNVDAEGTLRQALLRFGPTDNLELFEYDVSGQRLEKPRNSDVGATHIAFYVDDVDEAVRYLRSVPGVHVLAQPETILDGPIAGDRWVYFETPVGLSMEVLCMPDGSMPYETTTDSRRAPASPGRWSQTDPHIH
jgi:catechol 2,3-dioxygenase-like lactoylglutathione lyase family enzyme